MARPFTTMRSSARPPQFAYLRRLHGSGVAIWLSVLTILFCAILPVGLPQTASHGSAFNPATTSVVVLAKGLQRRLAIGAEAAPDLDTHRDTHSRPVLSLSALPAPVPRALADTAGPVAGIGFALRRLNPLGIRLARAPPAA